MSDGKLAMKILAILTCFNRKEKTEKCIRTLTAANPMCDITFIVVDDGSTDGTKEVIEKVQREYSIFYLQGNGSLFYSGGMRMGMTYALNSLKEEFDYLLMTNDDVEFLEHGVEAMITQSRQQQNSVIVGAMKNNSGELSYSAIQYTKGIKYRKVSLKDWEKAADTFNANCVLIPYQDFKRVGAIDSHYIHSLGDFDYGLELKRSGCKIFVSKDFVGTCNNNPIQNTWMDTALGRKERIRKKESAKGAPIGTWFYFLKKNFGVLTALRGCITPYIRILIGK